MPIVWCARVPIFRNTLVLKQLGLAIGVPFGLLVIILAFLSEKTIYTLYALGLVSTLLFLTWLFVLTVYGGQYEVEFILDSQGVLCRTQAKQIQRNKVINTLAITAGLLSGKPSVVGAGMLAQSRQSEFLKWSRVTRVKYQPQQQTILLRGGWTENIALFCTECNYQQVAQVVRNQTKHLESDCANGIAH